VDDSPASHNAVAHAAVEAELHHWDLRLLHVQPAGMAPYPARDLGARLLERMAGKVHACAPDVAVSSHVAVGAAATELLAELFDIDLAVVGYRSGLGRTAFGLSIAEQVAARHKGPVLMVRVAGGSPGSGFTDRPIVVGLDDPMSSARALDFARTEAKLRRCELIVLHAAGDGPEREDHHDTPGDTRERHRAVAGDPIKALLAASERAAAVIVGRHGGAGVATGFVGPVGRALTRDASCPVFLIG
jgi:nucleotide-binding universal stress UspA family protein